MTSRHLVVSAVNFTEGGPLTILLEGLESAAATLGKEWRITALVHSESLIESDRVHAIAFPESKASWLNRLRLEWSGFAALSRELKPDLWVSLHDVTPCVQARRQAVYCHNPSPFYRPSLTEARFDPRFFLFNKLYMRLYALFIRRNYAVIVQQSWLRDAFRRKTGHPNIVVAYPGLVSAEPEEAGSAIPEGKPPRVPTPGRPLRLLYPSLPRVFKNMEVLCEAAKLLPAEVAEQIDVRMTLDGSENRWARELVRRYAGVQGVRFIGRQDRDQMAAEYEDCDVVLFPSRLETWGLPITEAKGFGKPLLVAALPYARETTGTYGNVSFLPPNDPRAWSDAFVEMVGGRWKAEGNVAALPEQPFVRDWPALWRYLTEGL
ncbi:glycosyltransferase [Sphingomonas sp. KR3-1]|uniref:glycosyltransferase n=1 Tax=Sphingomonas sp. KR3-1 TaxID=3156611 RepID=UPI0032B4D1A3